jgi:RNA polymerase sigma-70 factor (ECF subfamily)
MHTTSASLLRRLKQSADRETTWARFVHLYTPLLYHWARKLGLTAHDAADLVQEVFTLLLRKLPEFDYQPERSFRGWLRTVTLNRWRDLCARRRVPVEDAALVPEPAGPDPVEVFAEEEYRRHLVRRALEVMQAEFPPATWRACWEYMIAARPPGEVARELGITVNAVYLAKSRVLSRLRQELEGLLD